MLIVTKLSQACEIICWSKFIVLHNSLCFLYKWSSLSSEVTILLRLIFLIHSNGKQEHQTPRWVFEWAINTLSRRRGHKNIETAALHCIVRVQVKSAGNAHTTPCTIASSEEQRNHYLPRVAGKLVLIITVTLHKLFILG